MSWDYWDDGGSFSETTVTTTTTVEGSPEMEIAGDLKRKREGNQFYVIDPADKSKTWVNDKDDLYEDAQDRIWRLI